MTSKQHNPEKNYGSLSSHKRIATRWRDRPEMIKSRNRGYDMIQLLLAKPLAYVCTRYPTRAERKRLFRI